MKSFIAVVIKRCNAETQIITSHQPSAHIIRAAKDVLANDPANITSITISRVSPQRVMILEVLTPSSTAPEGR